MAACMSCPRGYGILNPTTTKAGMAWFSAAAARHRVGLKQVGLPLGGALGALVMPPLALAFGWRTAVGAPRGAGGRARPRDLAPLPRAAPVAPGWRVGRALSLRMILGHRDLWLVASSTLVFAGLQTVLMGFLVLYLDRGAASLAGRPRDTIS
jgi:hypothetical protein